MNNKPKIVVAVTGASGSLYAHLLLKKLSGLDSHLAACDVVLSSNAVAVWTHELGFDPEVSIPFKIYNDNDFGAPFASGSSGYSCMIVCPCSMGTLGRIASGISDNLITRAADVMLKERGKLILVARETPYNIIHLHNMQAVTQAGAIVCPATPSFYSLPKTIEEVAMTVVDRVLSLAGLPSGMKSWGS